jgi:hypothetical protein
VAASTVVPSRVQRTDRARAAMVAARTAPRGAGLAPVLPLPLRALPLEDGAGEGTETGDRGATSYGSSGGASGPDARPDRVRPDLRPVPVRGGSRTASRRRLVALVAAVIVVGLASGIGRAALAVPEEPAVLGHVVLQPGETLWDVAVRSAPAGVDPRQQLDVLRRLNGFGPGALDAWTVVLVPVP